MAAFKILGSGTQVFRDCLATFSFSGLRYTPVFIPARLRNRRQMPTKKKINPFVSRYTDVIKHLSITLVKYERLLTTLGRARELQKYGNLLIDLMHRKQPPPDLFMIENGFLMTDEEAKEKLIVKRIINRKTKRILKYPDEMTEAEYREGCQREISNILLEDQEALDKLYGELFNRYEGQYGGFVKITKVPHPPKQYYPRLAYVEYIGNELPPLIGLPEVANGRLKTFPQGKDLEITS